eukprot:Opistho-1_new@14362
MVASRAHPKHGDGDDDDDTAFGMMLSAEEHGHKHHGHGHHGHGHGHQDRGAVEAFRLPEMTPSGSEGSLPTATAGEKPVSLPGTIDAATAAAASAGDTPATRTPGTGDSAGELHAMQDMPRREPTLNEEAAAVRSSASLQDRHLLQRPSPASSRTRTADSAVLPAGTHSDPLPAIRRNVVDGQDEQTAQHETGEGAAEPVQEVAVTYAEDGDSGVPDSAAEITNDIESTGGHKRKEE